MGAKGGRAAQTHGWPSINCVDSWGNLVGTLPRTRGGVVILLMSVAWESLADRPRGGCLSGHLAFLVLTLAKALTYFPYKSPHSLHGENQIRVEV
jgi:hypothetical protein